jgi:hypothetical protein
MRLNLLVEGPFVNVVLFVCDGDHYIRFEFADDVTFDIFIRAAISTHCLNNQYILYHRTIRINELPMEIGSSI